MSIPTQIPTPPPAPLVPEADPDNHWDFKVTGVTASAGAGDLTAYLAGLGYGQSATRGALAVGVEADGTVRVNANRDPTHDLLAYSPPPPPPQIDVLQTLLVALTGTDAQKQQAVANVQAVLAAAPSQRRHSVTR